MKLFKRKDSDGYERADPVLEDLIEYIDAFRRGEPYMASIHEGYALLQEEMDELWEDVKVTRLHDDYSQLRRRALRVAARAVQLVEDGVDKRVRP